MADTLTREEYIQHRGEPPAPPIVDPPELLVVASEPDPGAIRPCGVCGGSLPAGKRRYCSDDCTAEHNRRRAREAAQKQRGATRAAARVVESASASAATTASAALTLTLPNLVAQLLAADPTIAIDVELDGAQLTIRRQ